MSDMILLGTRKGTVIFDRSNSTWRPRSIAQAGIPVCYVALDPRDGTLWASLDHGHWGPKLSRSRDGGTTWENVLSLKYPEGARYIVKYLPTPDFDPAAPVGLPEYKDATVFKIWNLIFGNADKPGRLYAGTIPVVCLLAMMAATVGNSTGRCGIMKVVAAICSPVRRPVRTAGLAHRRV